MVALVPNGLVPLTVKLSSLSWTLTSSYTIYLRLWTLMTYNFIKQPLFFLTCIFFWQGLTWCCLAITSFMKRSLTLPGVVGCWSSCFPVTLSSPLPSSTQSSFPLRPSVLLPENCTSALLLKNRWPYMCFLCFFIHRLAVVTLCFLKSSVPMHDCLSKVLSSLRAVLTSAWHDYWVD